MKGQFDENTRLSQAIAFAIKMHNKSGQTREDRITPYYVHILRVIERLQREKSTIIDDDVLVAAALHDVVEDCGVTYKELSSQFGEKIALYVEDVTIARGESRESSKYMERLCNASRGGKIIKLADKLDNVWELRKQAYRSYGNITPREYSMNAKAVLGSCRDAHFSLAYKLENEINLLDKSIG